MKKSIVLTIGTILLISAAGPLLENPEGKGIVQEEKSRPELKIEVVKLKYIQASQAMQILSPYSSSPFGRIMPESRLQILTIKDTPEIIDKMLAVLKEIDVRPLDMQFSVDLILGYTEDQKKEFDRSIKADPVLNEIARMMSFRYLDRLDTVLIRAQNGEHCEQRLAGKGMSFRLGIMPRYVKEKEGDKIILRMDLNQMVPVGDKERGVTLIHTSLTLKNGERTVVGVSKLNGGDKAIILIIKGEGT